MIPQSAIDFSIIDRDIVQNLEIYKRTLNVRAALRVTSGARGRKLHLMPRMHPHFHHQQISRTMRRSAEMLMTSRRPLLGLGLLQVSPQSVRFHTTRMQRFLTF